MVTKELSSRPERSVVEGPAVLTYHSRNQFLLAAPSYTSPATKAGRPIRARFWLEWDTTAVDAPLFLLLGAKPRDLQCAPIPSSIFGVRHHQRCRLYRFAAKQARDCEYGDD